MQVQRPYLAGLRLAVACLVAGLIFWIGGLSHMVSYAAAELTVPVVGAFRVAHPSTAQPGGESLARGKSAGGMI